MAAQLWSSLSRASTISATYLFKNSEQRDRGYHFGKNKKTLCDFCFRTPTPRENELENGSRENEPQNESQMLFIFCN